MTNQWLFMLEDGDKLNNRYRNRFLIVGPNTYHEIIKNNLNKEIIFISDDINWCKENFNQYNNVKFFDDNIKNKLIYDQYIMANCETLVFNLDSSFSNVPFFIKNNKIKNAIIIVSDATYENSWNKSKNFAINAFTNIFKKEISIINGKDE